MLGRSSWTWCAALVLACSTTFLAPSGVTGQASRCFPDETRQSFNPSIARSAETFGMALFRQVAASQPNQSVFISPYSIWSALVLAYYGSKGNTERELKSALNLSSKTGTYASWGALKVLLEKKSSQSARFNSLNRAYFSKHLNISECLSTILPDIKKVDFTRTVETRALINNAVSVATEGKIPELLKFVDPQTQFALINAVFFKGKWKSSFKKEDTGIHDFIVPPGVPGGLVEMMKQTGHFNYGYSRVLDASILELPYNDSTVSMFILLPSTLENPRVQDTRAVLERLTPKNFGDAYKNNMTSKLLNVKLPKFKLTTRIEEELQKNLESMGIKDLFQRGIADLTDFAKRPPFGVDDTIHEATIEVNEEGTVAAAATALVNTRIAEPRPLNFTCNRPFVLLLTDKSTAVTLFAANILRGSDLERLTTLTG